MSETATPDTAGIEGLRLKSARGRWVVTATVLGSGIAALDATVVGIALPAIGRDFHAGVASLQWVVDAYTLTLAGLLLLGGTLGDSYGRRKVFVIGIVWFAIASLRPGGWCSSSTCRWRWRSWPSPPGTCPRRRRQVRCRGWTSRVRSASAARWPGSPTG